MRDRRTDGRADGRTGGQADSSRSEQASPHSSIALGPGAEFDRIRSIVQRLGDRAVGLGDDCALLDLPAGTLAISTDLSIENVHFQRHWLTLEEIGWRAAGAALSDLAAEAASPAGVFASVGVPPDAAEDAAARVMEGVAAAAASVGAKVLGGDLTRAPVWIIDVTVLGPAKNPVTRDGARPGDLLWVSGNLGGARAALVAWQSGGEPAEEARRAFAHPEPRVKLGQLLAAHGARAMLDISDGLAGDAAHLAAASAVSLEIDLDALPRSATVSDVARGLDEPEAVFAARGGEDYELLVALPAEFSRSDAIELTFQSGVALTPIGRVLEGSGLRLLLAGKPIRLGGFDHFVR